MHARAYLKLASCVSRETSFCKRFWPFAYRPYERINGALIETFWIKLGDPCYGDRSGCLPKSLTCIRIEILIIERDVGIIFAAYTDKA